MTTTTTTTTTVNTKILVVTVTVTVTVTATMEEGVGRRFLFQQRLVSDWFGSTMIVTFLFKIQEEV